MNSFLQSLHAAGPAAEHANKLMLYGQFVGDWEAEGHAFLPDGSVRRHYWQVRFDWVLEGRAVQDVWITPPRGGLRAGQSERWGPFDNQYGTTIRVYDPKIDAWRVMWIDPCAGYRADLIGRLKDGEIFQEGTGSDGARVRWIFSNISHRAFLWHAEISRNDGASWHKALELRAQRT